jgi:2-polyprenyl-3-methyl-5-hydroxy-6-metoxy-1,4-benzoquinol methylase
MPKKIKFESYKYRLLAAAQEYEIQNPGELKWKDFLNSLVFKYKKNKILISSANFNSPIEEFDLKEPLFYKSIANNSEEGAIDYKRYNEDYFNSVLKKIASKAEIVVVKKKNKNLNTFEAEERFHDAWAKNENFKEIDVVARNEALTAPEMRHITSKLGDLEGKSLLDVGCGLGEASVYFALKGASVTSSDLSSEMLVNTKKLAEHHCVSVTTHLASSDRMELQPESFDIIYAGNLMHHVDIADTVVKIKKLLKKNGVLVTWDPLAYNPIINVYRKIATEVRTIDEHPFTVNDIKTFKRNFSTVETSYFWLTTLVIFLMMYFKQKKNPNEERFWKVVVDESENWEKLYKPLEKIDKILLKLLPPLRLLCWNVVIFAKK